MMMHIDLLASMASLRLAARNVLRHRDRTLMALAAIALGVAALIVAGGFIQDVYVQFAEALIHSQYGHLQIYRKGYFAHGTQRPTEYIIENPAALIRRLEATSDVVSVLPRLRFAGTANAGGADFAIAAEGVMPGSENRLGTFLHLVEGRRLIDADTYGAFIGEGVAKALHIHPGVPISINVVTREGAVNTLDFEVVGTFRSHSKDYDQRAIRLNLNGAHELLGTDGVNEVVVELRQTAATDRVAVALEPGLAKDGFEILPWHALADFYGKTVILFDRQFGFLQIVLLAMIGLSVSNIINTATYERMPEFGTMLALGDRRRTVFALIITECVVLGVAGTLAGILLGAALAWLISAVGIPMPPPPNADLGYIARIRVVYSVLVNAGAVGLISTVLAGILPSTKVARTPPVDALRRAV